MSLESNEHVTQLVRYRKLVPKRYRIVIELFWEPSADISKEGDRR